MKTNPQLLMRKLQSLSRTIINLKIQMNLAMLVMNSVYLRLPHRSDNNKMTVKALGWQQVVVSLLCVKRLAFLAN